MCIRYERLVEEHTIRRKEAVSYQLDKCLEKFTSYGLPISFVFNTDIETSEFEITDLLKIRHFSNVSVVENKNGNYDITLMCNKW